MESLYIVVLILLLVIIPSIERRRRAAAVKHIINKKKQKIEDKAMEELAKQFVGKECIIYTLASNDSYIKGIIKNVSDGGMIIDNNGNIEAVNLEFVTRIREYPRNSKGKKKSVII